MNDIDIYIWLTEARIAEARCAEQESKGQTHSSNKNEQKEHNFIDRKRPASELWHSNQASCPYLKKTQNEVPTDLRQGRSVPYEKETETKVGRYLIVHTCSLPRDDQQLMHVDGIIVGAKG